MENQRRNESMANLVMKKISKVRYLVEQRKADNNVLVANGREMRFLNDVIQFIHDNDFQSVKNVLETRFKKKDKSSNGNFLFIADGGNERFAREIEASIVEASRLRDPTILKYLLLHGAQVNFVTEPPSNGLQPRVSPLHVAVEQGLTDTVAVLLENNADVNRLDYTGSSALHLAVRRADCECTRMLLFRGAQVGLLDADGRTPLQTAARFGHVELVRTLLEHSAQIFHEGQRGASPLHVAALEGHVPLIDIFSRYVDVNIRVACGGVHNDDANDRQVEKTALHLAAERGLIETVRFLLERFGADVNVLDSDDQSALHCALLHKHDHRRMRRKEDFDAIVELFVKKHVRLNQPNLAGDRPLHLAARNQYHRAVELMLLAHADPLLKNDADQIPLDVIAEYDAPMRQLFTKYAVLTPPHYNKQNTPSSPDSNISCRWSDHVHEQLTHVEPMSMSSPERSPRRKSPKDKPAPTPKQPTRAAPGGKENKRVFQLHVRSVNYTESNTDHGEAPYPNAIYPPIDQFKTPSAPNIEH